MSEWKKVKLGDISLCIQPGPFGTQLHNSDYTDKGIPVIMPKDMIDGRVFHDKLEHVSEDTANRISRHKVVAGDIMVARKGDVRKCIYIRESEEGWITGSDCLKLQLNQKICNSKFIYYQLRSPYIGAWLQQVSKGATMPSLNTSLLSNIEIVLPPIPIQNYVAEILSRYDSLIENYQKQIKLLEEAAQRLYKEWFVDLHFPGHENTKIADGVPEGWEKKKISDVCNTIGGGTPSTKVLSYYENGTISWVTPTDITKNNSLCLLSTEKKITKEGLDNSSAKMLPAETILMTSRASVGYFGICDFEVCTNQGFISCVPFDNNFQMYLLYNLMNRVEEIRIKAGGSTYMEISKSVFRNFDIICPTDNLINKFQQETHQLLERMKMICKQIRLLTEARDRLLPKLMSGEIAV